MIFLVVIQHCTNELIEGGYGIPNQPHRQAMNCYEHLTRWIQYLELNFYGRPMEADDLIFPAISCNGVWRKGEQMSHEAIQKMIDEGVEAVNLPRPGNGSYSTHCFRRGGAQYWFMFAPAGDRWNLQRIRWWGGWSEHESVRASLVLPGRVIY